MENLIPDVAGHLGISPSTALFYMLVISGAANVVGRLIPDDKTGFLGGVREVAKVLGLYVSNRVTTGVKTGDVIKGIVTSRIENEVKDKLQTLDLEDVLPPDAVEEVEESTRPIVPAFPRLQRQPIDPLSSDFPATFKD